MVLDTDIVSTYRSSLEKQWRELSKRHQLTVGFIGIGVLAGVVGFASPGEREVLFALAFVSLFGAVLTNAVMHSENSLQRSSRSVFETYAATIEAMACELDIQGTARYVPKSGSDQRPGQVRLVVGEEPDAGPAASGEASLFARRDHRIDGFSIVPAGVYLYHEFGNVAVGEPASQVGELTTYLADGVVEGLELAAAVTVLECGEQRVVVGVRDSAHGPINRIDHPVVSFLATGIATTLASTVEVTSIERYDDRMDEITLAWSE